jgi:FkbM family methyltransferase
MNAMQAAARRAVILYGVRLPYHRGKWRVIDGALRVFRLDGPHASGTVEAERAGFRFDFDLGRYLDRTLYYHGGFESYDVRAARALVPAGGVALDVGANIGWWTLHLHRWVGAEGRVLAFEPDASERARLERNLALNHAANVVVSAEAVSDTTGRVFLSPTFDGGTTHIVDEAEAAGASVDATTVDAVVERAGLARLDFIKCDIEGAEMRFLAGAGETVRRFRPAMMLELFEPNLRQFGTSRAELAARLRELGYTLHLAHGGRMREMRELPPERENANVFAFPR